MAGSPLVDYAVAHLVKARVVGCCLHSCAYLPFGEPDKPNEWLDPRLFGDLKLKLTGEAGLGVTKVLTQQLRI